MSNLLALDRKNECSLLGIKMELDNLNRYVLNRNIMNATGIRTVWEENSPDSLVDLSARCILRNPSILFYAIDVTRVRRRGTITSSDINTIIARDVVEHEDEISEKGR